MTYIGSISSPYESPTFGTSLSLRVNGGFNAVSINPSGRDVVLASRSGLFVIDLDDPFSPPRWLHHDTPWQVADVQWYPHPAKPYWVVSTSNQKALIWNLTRSALNAIEYVLHGHSRAITDINFSPQNPDILATCSIDTYVHAWDMRSPSRPFFSTSSWKSSASQVKWNFKDPNILASSHGNDVFIWDIRHGSTPLFKFEGHESGVNSIDFNKFNRNEIMSSSNDGTVKFWDLSHDGSCLKTISADFPIWRGRYLPFGNGFCIMPTVGGNNSVFLMNLNKNNTDDDSDTNNINCNTSSTTTTSNNNFTINNLNANEKIEKLQPVHTFKGHSDRVIDFLWRSRHSHDSTVDDREFQLVTWSKDSDLRLWPIMDEIYEKVNFDRNQQLNEKLPNYEYISFNRFANDSNQSCEENINGYINMKEYFVTTSGLTRSDDIDHLNWLSGVRMNRQDTQNDLFEDTKLQNLGEEVSSIGHNFPNIIFEKISVSTGELVLTLKGPWSKSDTEPNIFLRIGIKVPPHYPNKGNPPKFEIEENNNLLPETKKAIVSKLIEICETYTNINQYCLEACLRYLLGEEINLDDIENIGNEPLFNFDMNTHLDLESFGSLSDIDGNSQLLDSSSSTSSESGLLKNTFIAEQVNPNNPFGRNLAFDSTPVPNLCGAVWSPTGKLVTFFVAENKIDRLTFNNWELSEKTLSKKQSISNYEPQELFDPNDNRLFQNLRPKRYVDTFSTHGNNTEQEDNTSDEQSTSESSLYSFVDEWHDIIGNDVLVRTKLPTLYDNFARTIGSLPSESARTDTSRKTKNIILDTDFSHLLPDNKNLALEYQVMDNSPGEMARHNALVAEKYGFEEISHCWQILSDLFMENNSDDPLAFISECHSLTVQWFVRGALKYFEKLNNLQMVAMLCCVLAYQPKHTSSYDKDMTSSINMESTVTFDKMEGSVNYLSNDSSSIYSRTSTPVGTNTAINNTVIDNYQRYSHLSPSGNNNLAKSKDITMNTNTRTNYSLFRTSPSLSRNSMRPYSQPQSSTVEKDSNIPIIQVQLIDDEVVNVKKRINYDILGSDTLTRYKNYVYQYSNLLFQWMLPIERAKILKVDIDILCNKICRNSHLQQPSSTFIGNTEISSNGVITSWLRKPPKDYTFYNCNYCLLKIVGDAFICGNCQHALHRKCAMEWWDVGDECPAGCGCDCVNFFDVQ